MVSITIKLLYLKYRRYQHCSYLPYNIIIGDQILFGQYFIMTFVFACQNCYAWYFNNAYQKPDDPLNRNFITINRCLVL